MTMIRVFVVATALAALSVGAQAAPRHAHPDPAAARAEAAKRAACEKVWDAQKVRHGSRERFVAACVAKG